MDPYDPRYLAGVVLFNEQDFFGAHEVWEDLWADSYGDERRFYQGLIQAAVGLCHFGNGNLNGAVKLYHSSREYMRPCGSSLAGPGHRRVLARHGGVLPAPAGAGLRPERPARRGVAADDPPGADARELAGPGRLLAGGRRVTSDGGADHEPGPLLAGRLRRGRQAVPAAEPRAVPARRPAAARLRAALPRN